MERKGSWAPSYLLIVSRDHPECHRRLRTAFEDDPQMTLILDRRFRRAPSGEGAPAWTPERRRRDISDRLRTLGWALVELEVPPAPPAEATADDRTGAGEASPRGRARILVVEDEPFVLGMILEVLRHGGYAPTATNDPWEALALLATEIFDLVVVDLVMPHLDGLQVLEKVKERNPSAAVLMISAFGTDRVVRESREKGAADFLAKPFQITSFLAAVERLLPPG